MLKLEDFTNLLTKLENDFQSSLHNHSKVIGMIDAVKYLMELYNKVEEPAPTISAKSDDETIVG